MMAVDVDLGEVFRNGPPRELMTGPYRLCRVGGRDFNVDADGSFVLVRRTPANPAKWCFCAVGNPPIPPSKRIVSSWISGPRIGL